MYLRFNNSYKSTKKIKVHKDVNIVIMIKLKDTYLFYNCETEKETTDIYSELISLSK